MIEKPLLHDLDLMMMFKIERKGRPAYTFLFTASPDKTFLGKTQEDLWEMFEDLCLDVEIGEGTARFFFSEETPIADMFIFREKINKLTLNVLLEK